MAEVSEEKEEAREAETSEDSAEKRAQWRKARLESLEEDAIQAQIVIEKMSELSTSTTTGRILWRIFRCHQDIALLILM